jgi:hypothetical protein
LSIDPILSLAVTVQSNPGAYALLLGSGVSRAAGVPTGWEVTLDLVRRVAAAAKQDVGADPEAWYTKRFRSAPLYSDLIAKVTKSRAERSRLFRSYFEPTDEEREQGVKVPTPGHHAIARLVAGGYIRLILETNFDHLVENAIEQTAGVVPTVISTVDALQGAAPLVHSGCTVVKLHGDYLDTRILNTEAELARYPRPLERYLDRVFDEFGLVVVGWSGEWDGALRAAIERRKSRRYGIYWATRHQPQAEAGRLIQLQTAEVITISDADTFLSDLAESVQSVAEVQRRPPLAVDTAVATIKRFLVDDRSRIRLHDLVTAEVERAYAQIGPAPGSVTISSDLVTGWVRQAEVSTEVLNAMVACGAYWGPSYNDLWTQAVQRLANPGDANATMNEGFDPRYLSALLVLYAAGIGAVAGGNYECLQAMLQQAYIREYQSEIPIGGKLHPSAVLDNRFAGVLPVVPRAHTPFSQYLEPALRGTLRSVIASDSDYLDAFDRFEYLLSLVCADYHLEKGHIPLSFLGCFAWRRRIVTVIDREIAEQGIAWPALRLFGTTSFDRLNASRKVIKEAMPGYWG